MCCRRCTPRVWDLISWTEKYDSSSKLLSKRMVHFEYIIYSKMTVFQDILDITLFLQATSNATLGGKAFDYIKDNISPLSGKKFASCLCHYLVTA